MTAAPADRPTITEPGVYNMAAEDYHRDPIPGGSLSSTGARKLLPPSCPAKYRQWADEGSAPKRHFDLGIAAHMLVLGAGRKLHLIDADNYKTKKAQEEQHAAHAEGWIPLLPAEHDQVQAMAAAIREHPLAAQLLNPDHGRAEQVVVVRDEETGIWKRGQLDWIWHRDGQRPVIVDYKSARAVDPDSLSKALWDHRYCQQGAWYRDLVRDCGAFGGAEPAFLLIAQEKEEPYLVNVAQPDHEAILWGDRLNRRAIHIYAECRDTGRWPGYSDEVTPLALPRYALYQLEDAWAAGELDPE